MADKQISELTAVTTPLDGTELFHVVQGGDSKRAATADLVTSSAMQTALDAKAAVSTVPSVTYVIGHTVEPSDMGKIVRMNLVGLPNAVTVNAGSVPVNSWVVVTQVGTGQTEFIAGPGVTFNSDGGKLKLKGQYSAALLTQTSLNVWLIVGDLVA